MRNFRIVVQYEGTRYQGWQKQDSTDNTLQGKFEAILGKLCGGTVEIQASGRTDAGVHARGQVANFHLDTTHSSGEILEYVNRYLPEDVAVTAIEEVPERFHSRLNAKEKTYMYRVLNSGIPHIFDRRYVWQVAEPLNREAMKEAASQLEGTHDFKAFTSAKRGRKTTVRTIYGIGIEDVGEEIRFTFRGNGFLYHMVRIIMGTLLEVGKGTMGKEEIPEILKSGSRERAGALVPAKGLTLMEVKY